MFHFLISQLAGSGCRRPRPCIIDTVLSQAAAGVSPRSLTMRTQFLLVMLTNIFCSNPILLPLRLTLIWQRRDGLISKQRLLWALLPIFTSASIQMDSCLHHSAGSKGNREFTPSSHTRCWHLQSGSQMLIKKKQKKTTKNLATMEIFLWICVLWYPLQFSEPISFFLLWVV